MGYFHLFTLLLCIFLFETTVQNNLSTFLCLSQAKSCLSCAICCGHFCVQLLKMRGCSSFCWCRRKLLILVHIQNYAWPLEPVIRFECLRLSGSKTIQWFEIWYCLTDANVVVYKVCIFIMASPHGIAPNGKNNTSFFLRNHKLDWIQTVQEWSLDILSNTFFMCYGNPRWPPLQDKVWIRSYEKNV